MNFFTALAADLKGPLSTIKSQEAAVVGPALASIIPPALANPTKAGLIAAAAPALAQILTAQPSIAVELITDLVTAAQQLA